jgi:hypothetical protein
MGVSTYWYTINYRILTPPLQTLTINITVTFAVTLYAIYVYKVERSNNIYIFHILPIIQYLLYGRLFTQLFGQIFVKRLVWLSVGLFTVVSLLLSFTIQPWDKYNSYAATLFNLLIVLWSGYYLWRTLIDTKVIALEKEALFWIIVGLLVTSLGNFFVQGLMNYLITNSDSYALAVYWIRELMSFVLFISFLVALFIYIRQSRGKYAR